MLRRLSDWRFFIPLIVTAFAISVVVVGLMIPRMASRFVIDPVGAGFTESSSRSGVVYDTWRRGGDGLSAAGLPVASGKGSIDKSVFQYDANLSVEVTDVGVTSFMVREEVERTGGYVESFAAGGVGHGEYAEMVLRVPVDHHSSVMSMIRGLGLVLAEREVKSLVVEATPFGSPEVAGLQALLDAHVAQLLESGQDRERLLKAIAYLETQIAAAGGRSGGSTEPVLHSTVVLHLITGSAVEVSSRLETVIVAVADAIAVSEHLKRSAPKVGAVVMSAFERHSVDRSEVRVTVDLHRSYLSDLKTLILDYGVFTAGTDLPGYAFTIRDSVVTVDVVFVSSPMGNASLVMYSRDPDDAVRRLVDLIEDRGGYAVSYERRKVDDRNVAYFLGTLPSLAFDDFVDEGERFGKWRERYYDGDFITNRRGSGRYIFVAVEVLDKRGGPADWVYWTIATVLVSVVFGFVGMVWAGRSGDSDEQTERVWDPDDEVKLVGFLDSWVRL